MTNKVNESDLLIGHGRGGRYDVAGGTTPISCALASGFKHGEDGVVVGLEGVVSYWVHRRLQVPKKARRGSLSLPGGLGDPQEALTRGFDLLTSLI